MCHIFKDAISTESWAAETSDILEDLGTSPLLPKQIGRLGGGGSTALGEWINQRGSLLESPMSSLISELLVFVTEG